MLLRSIELAGWRSFAPAHPAKLTGFGQVNLLIGPNNVGKSNVGRFLVKLRDWLVGLGFANVEPWNQHGNSSTWQRPFRLSIQREEVDHWLRKEQPITAEIVLSAQALMCPFELPGYVRHGETIHVRVDIRSDGDSNGILSLVPVCDSGKPFLSLENGAVQLLLQDATYTGNPEVQHRGLALAVCWCLARSVIEIRPLRDVSKRAEKKRDRMAAPLHPTAPAPAIRRSTDGGNVMELLHAHEHDKNKQRLWTQCKQDLSAWFATLLAEERVDLQVQQDDVLIEVKREGGLFRCGLADLGSGVSELLMVMAYLRLCPDDELIVVVDEPEAHLHPGAVVEMFRLITAHLPKHQLLVTTHSTALVDAVGPGWQLYRAWRTVHFGTAFERLDAQTTELALLADLGIRPSQLFLANAALWVEGPSDVHYWTALLRRADSTLVAGRDFSFVPYGGASAVHLRFLDDNGQADEPPLVKMLQVSHRAAVLCDRDLPTTEDTRDECTRELVRRLRAAAQSIPDHACVEETPGLEIENSVRPEVLHQEIEQIAPQELRRPDRVRLVYEPYAVGPDEPFEKAAAGAARKEDGTSLTPSQTKRIAELIAAKKVELAARIRERADSSSECVFTDAAMEQAQRLAAWLRR